MEVAFYHDDPSSRLSGAYDPQSSPGSVESINSTDAGPVSAIATVPPAYRHYSGHDFNKAAALKGMSLSLNGQGIDYGRPQQHHHQQPQQQQQQQHLGTLPNGSVITTNPCTASSYQHTGVITNSYAALNDATASSLSVNIPDNGGNLSAAAISTPDVLNMLKATTPDFDRPLSQSSQIEASNSFYRNVTQEQEMYAQGFVRELERLKSQSGSNPNIAASAVAHSPSGASQCSVITSGMQQQQQHHHQQMHPAYGSPDTYYAEQQQHDSPGTSGLGTSQTIHHMGAVMPHPNARIPQHGSVISHMKEEPSQIVPVISKSPPMSPINLEHQERIKTERKRMRNRVAASKCRKRKLERISRLEEKVNSLKNQNLELSTNANVLRQQVAELKSKVMAHVNSGCQLMMSQQQVTF